MATEKTTRQHAAKKTARKQSAKAPGNTITRVSSKSMPKAGKDPQGGLTAKGREYFAQKEGSHLRPGVQGPADTPEKMVRKGSFLRRHFTRPRGPMKDDKGQTTRLALSAHAWGEPVPETMADARKLADEGHELLEQYHAAKEDGQAQPKPKNASAKKSPAKRKAVGAGASSAKKSSSKKKAIAKIGSRGSGRVG